MRFTKMHGAGNDYIFVDGRGETRDWPAVARRVSDRHFGIGSDGLIVAVPSDEADIRMRMWNSDGSESEMCGNGIRCFAKFVIEGGIAPLGGASALSVQTGAGVLSVTPLRLDGAIVKAVVDMGEPILRAASVPVDPSQLGPSDLARLDAGLLAKLGIAPYDIVFDAPALAAGDEFPVTAVSTGNPHAVAFVDQDVASLDLGRVGPVMEHHPAFPNRVNFHIVNVLGRDRLRSRTWERGAGETLACATGAVGMTVAARLHGFINHRVTVEVPGGELAVTWPGHGSAIMEGPVEEVFSGEIPD